MDQLASAASRILASKKIQEVTLPQLALKSKTAAEQIVLLPGFEAPASPEAHCGLKLETCRVSKLLIPSALAAKPTCSTARLHATTHDASDAGHARGFPVPSPAMRMDCRQLRGSVLCVSVGHS